MVELAEPVELYDNPLHPLSQALLSAIPIPHLKEGLSTLVHRRSAVPTTSALLSSLGAAVSVLSDRTKEAAQQGYW